MEISGYEENGAGYFLKQRMSETAEIRLLMDAVYSFPFITDCELYPRGKDFDPKISVEQAVYAYSGEPEPVVLHCGREIIDHIIDKYGTDIDMEEADDKKLKVCITVPPDGVKFWALQFLPHAEVISPQWLRNEIIECIKANPYMKA